ncbi:MAG: hypothetical protein ABIO92_01630 [Chloroflexia bacterium]
MSNWTPKQALSRLTSKFRKSDSDESSSYSSADEIDDPLDESEEAALVSQLAMMSENSPEAWLGQFLLILELGGVTRYGTIAGARRDRALQTRLASLRDVSAQDSPSPLFDSGAAEELKIRDWTAWWRGQDALSCYCYATLALSMLGDISHIDDIAAMYSQDANSRIRRDAHYVLCYLLGKEWPGYEVKPSDIVALHRRHSTQ